jgi:hypothetical protein
MHDEPTYGPGWSLPDPDARRQSEVLRLLLNEYPALLSVEEVVAELTEPGADGFDEHDGFVRAVDGLTRSGLLHRHDDFEWPSRAGKSARVLARGER